MQATGTLQETTQPQVVCEWSTVRMSITWMENSCGRTENYLGQIKI